MSTDDSSNSKGLSQNQIGGNQRPEKIASPDGLGTCSKSLHIERPETTVNPVRVDWVRAIGVTFIHLVAALAFLPWFFSWPAVVVMFVSIYVFATLGINLCYHRLLTHRGFQCSKRFEHFITILGVCSMQDSPAKWVATHRLHHQHSDNQPDPHSPLVNFLWGHCGWLFIENRECNNLNVYHRYARDLLHDPFFMRLEKKSLWAWIYLFHAMVYFTISYGFGAWFVPDAALQFALSLLIWGVFVRTVVAWHITWSVNSITHIWGYRNYDTSDNSRNNLLIGFASNGEGWHNNHHADQRAAAHGHRWWEFDVTWLTIRLLEKIGIVKDVIRPKSWSK